MREFKDSITGNSNDQAELPPSADDTPPPAK
jgi:hypothetical protein